MLHVVGRMDIGGAESRIMDLYRRIDRRKVQFWFMQHTEDHCAYEEEIKRLGGRVYSVPRFRVVNLMAYRRAWKAFFKAHPEVRIVHGHMTSTAGIYLPIARHRGHCYTIAHARSAGVDPGLKGVLTRLMRMGLWKKCDTCFTCSAPAGEAVFGKTAMEKGKVQFFPNAIETDRFRFEEADRFAVREELGLQGTFVLGHVGRFSPVKNHGFLLEVLKNCFLKEQDQAMGKTVLLLLGEGSLKEAVMRQAEDMGLSSRVVFAGNRTDVYRYYAAMDVFLLPSLYEGLPGTAIEAQACGLPGILSDRVTEEALITDLLVQRSISQPSEGEAAARWAEEIFRIRKANGNTSPQSRRAYAEKVKEQGYDALSQARWLQEFVEKIR